MMLLRPTLAAACLLLATQALAETYTARVVGVTDGDTVKALDGSKVLHTIRLASIDAPEKKQPYGQRAKQFLADQVFDRDVTFSCSKMDYRKKREVCVIDLDGSDVNLGMVQAGYSWWYRQYAREQTPTQRHAYAEAEATAREGRFGLWADDSPVPPWDWRHRKRSAPAKEWR